MTKKHHEELTEVARKIYDLAADEIQAYITKTYESKKGDTFASQLEDFHVIADEVAAYLMGNAMALVDESCWDDDLKTLTTHVRQMAAYVASCNRAQQGNIN